MSTRYFIAAALMASACIAHADVLPGTPALGTAVQSGGGAAVQALYDKVSASIGNSKNISLTQGSDAVYVTGLTAAQAVALAGDGMSAISTSNGYKIVQSGNDTANGTNGGGANMTAAGINTSTSTSTNTSTGSTNASTNASTNVTTKAGTAGTGTNITVGLGAATGSGSGDLGTQAAASGTVPEPSTVALMLAGMLGVAGLSRRRSR